MAYQGTMGRMSHFKEISLTLADGYTAYARYWEPAEIRGAVLCHHGIQSHAGWFEASAGRLVQAGFAVMQADRRGCGRNSQDRGHAESAEQLIDDARAARDELLRRTGCDGCEVLGVSWGGKLAVAVHAVDSGGTTGLHLVTPGLFPLSGVPSAEKARIGFAMLYEREQRFDIPLNEPEMFTQDPRWQAFFRTDELTLRQCSAAFYLASRRMDKLLVRLKDATPVPIHLMLAGDERIIDNERTAGFVRELNWPVRRITTYRTARHCLEFDVPEDYLRDLVAFMTRADGARGDAPASG